MKMSFRRRLARRSAIPAAIGMALLLAGLLAPGAQARSESFQPLAPSPVPLTSVTTVPATGLVYAQENGGNNFYVYDPRTDVWTELAPAPINSGNNGGATYLDGKIYTVYTGNGSEVGVYDLATGTWTTIPNPIGRGTGDITAGNGMLYLAIDREFVEYDPATEVTTPLAEAPPMQGSCNEGFEPWGGLQFTGDKIYGHQGDGCQGFAVYDVAGDSWTELPLTPEAEEEDEGPVLGSAFDPVTDTYLTYGPYDGKTLFRWDIEAGEWSTGTMPFEMNDAGSAYVSIPGHEGIYIVQGEGGVEFTRYTEQNTTDLAASMTANVVGSATGGEVTYSIGVKNDGPERADGVVVSDPLPAGTSLVSAPGCTGSTELSCALGVLPSGASAVVTVRVTAGFGTVTNTASVSSHALDTNPANDSASTVVELAHPTAPTANAPTTNPKCVVPSVRGLTLAKAKTALRGAGCRPGKLFHRHGDKIAKGSVIRGGNTPGKNIAPGSKVNLIVSLGKKVHGEASSGKR